MKSLLRIFLAFVTCSALAADAPVTADNVTKIVTHPAGPITFPSTVTATGGFIGGITVGDAASDTTMFPLLGTDATGSLAPKTDSGLLYNASTNRLTVGSGSATDLQGYLSTGLVETNYLLLNGIYFMPNRGGAITPSGLTVSTSGTTVTGTGVGTTFSSGAIVLSGIAYNVASVTNANTIVLSTAPPALTSVQPYALTSSLWSVPNSIGTPALFLNIGGTPSQSAFNVQSEVVNFVDSVTPTQTVNLAGATLNIGKFGDTTSTVINSDGTWTHSGLLKLGSGPTTINDSAGKVLSASLNTVAVANGGTGSTTAAGARTNLGATTVGANLFTLTNPSAISFPKIAADNTVSTRTPSQLTGDLSLTIGTNTQAWDADLDALAALVGTNTIYYRSGANTWSAVTIGTGLSFSAGSLTTDGTQVTTTTINNGTLPASFTTLATSGLYTASGGITVSGSALTLSGNQSVAAWTTNGVRIVGTAGTLTDTTSSGTVAAAYTNKLGGNTIAANSATTFTNYISGYFSEPVAGTNVTLTNKWGLGADSLYVGTSNPFKVTSAGAVSGTSLALGGATVSSTNILALSGSGFTTETITGNTAVGLNLTTSGSARAISLIAGTGAVLEFDSGGNFDFMSNVKASVGGGSGTTLARLYGATGGFYLGTSPSDPGAGNYSANNIIARGTLAVTGASTLTGGATVGAQVAQVGGTLKVDTTTTGNVGAGEDTLITYTIPAATLATNGDSIEFDTWGTCAANANTKDIKVYYGGTTLIDGGVVVLNGVDWKCHGRIVRTGAATQTANAELTVGGTLLSAVNGTICDTTAPTETLSGTVVFKVTGTSAISPNDHDIDQNGMVLRWVPNK